MRFTRKKNLPGCVYNSGSVSAVPGALQQHLSVTRTPITLEPSTCVIRLHQSGRVHRRPSATTRFVAAWHIIRALSMCRPPDTKGDYWAPPRPRSAEGPSGRSGCSFLLSASSSCVIMRMMRLPPAHRLLRPGQPRHLQHSPRPPAGEWESGRGPAELPAHEASL